MASESDSSMQKRLNLGALLIDLNGTIHVGPKATPGAVNALQRLRAAKIPFVFCSNSTKESTASLLGNLRDIGVQVEDREVLTSLGACRALVEQRNLNPLLLLSPSAKEEFAHITDSSKTHDSVILGLHPESLSYGPLNKAFRTLKGEPVKEGHRPAPCTYLIAPHASLFQQSPANDELPAGLSLGIGPFVRALELSSGVEAELVGKPTRRFFELAIDKIKEIYGEIEGNVAVIGDDVVNDLGDGAKEIGLGRILVRTGKYRDGVEKDHAPDGVYDNFAAFVDDLVGGP